MSAHLPEHPSWARGSRADRCTDLHVYDPATMRCRTCSHMWVCEGGQVRLLAEFRHRGLRELHTLLAESAAIAVSVLRAGSPEEIDAIHRRIRGWAPEADNAR